MKSYETLKSIKYLIDVDSFFEKINEYINKFKLEVESP
jgi:hypothetical protein